MKTKIALAALALTVTLPVLAQTPPTPGTNTPGIDQRELRQERRIDQGSQSGALTQREENRLDRGQSHIEKMEDRAKADGTVTGKERARLRQAENVQSRHIYQAKHDRQHDFNHDGLNDRSQRRQQRRNP